MTYVDEDIRDVLTACTAVSQMGFTAQVIATGPTVRASAMPEVFTALNPDEDTVWVWDLRFRLNL